MGGFKVICKELKQDRAHINIFDISLCPDNLKHKLIKLGRINKPFEPMFYGSLDYPPAYTGAIAKGNVFKTNNSVMLTIGVWKFVSPLKLYSFLAGMPQHSFLE